MEGNSCAPRIAGTMSAYCRMPPALQHRQILVAFSGLLLVMLLAALDSTIVSTALPTIVSTLGGLEHLAWVVTGYLLAQTVVTPVYGKLGDLYGRKIVLQSAVVLFLAGSALCGLSQSMTQLIAFRAIQGLGGGGLMVTTQAVVGDIIPPRDRGRYQGIFGAAYGAASIAGPLLGGYFTTHLSWRWIFYVNIPLGLLALVVLGATLPSRSERRSHSIDYVGAALLAVVLSALTLVADLGGTAYAWSSSFMITLIASALLALGLFVVTERRAAEPVLPPRLFTQRAFVVTSSVGLVVGFALFGSVTYLPVYLQVVRGATPTASGLQMLPMMGGMLVMSIVSGQLISRTGRYKRFPIMGTAVMTAGLFMLSRLGVNTTALQSSLIMLVVGLGLGMVMQVLIVAVQNAVDYRDLGVATSGATLFRLIGGSLGTAILGAIFSARLAHNLGSQLPAGASGQGINMATIAGMAPTVRNLYFAAFTHSLNTVFLVATAVGVVGFVLALFIPEMPLRATIAASTEEAGEEAASAFGRPSDEAGAEEQVYRALLALDDRAVQREHIVRIVERAGSTLSPLAAWLLVQIERHPERLPLDIALERQIEPSRAEGALAELVGVGLIGPGSREHRVVLTDTGCTVYGQLVHARREHLREIAQEWESTDRPDLDDLLGAAVGAGVAARPAGAHQLPE